MTETAHEWDQPGAVIPQPGQLWRKKWWVGVPRDVALYRVENDGDITGMTLLGNEDIMMIVSSEDGDPTWQNVKKRFQVLVNDCVWWTKSYTLIEWAERFGRVK